MLQTFRFIIVTKQKHVSYSRTKQAEEFSGFTRRVEKYHTGNKITLGTGLTSMLAIKKHLSYQCCLEAEHTHSCKAPDSINCGKEVLYQIFQKLQYSSCKTGIFSYFIPTHLWTCTVVVFSVFFTICVACTKKTYHLVVSIQLYLLISVCRQHDLTYSWK